jgi:hypothetical protein
MVEENKTESVEEPTVKFADDGKEHKINEMPDNAKELYLLWQEEKQNRDNFIINANKSIDKLNRILSSYESDMKNILEPAEDKPKIEVQ